MRAPPHARFSALQRAENSSMGVGAALPCLRRVFQCSSASRKFLNGAQSATTYLLCECFSALQRAENSSMTIQRNAGTDGMARFSALQRAENSSIHHYSSPSSASLKRFSALQRAENSSMIVVLRTDVMAERFSALQRAENSSILDRVARI